MLFCDCVNVDSRWAHFSRIVQSCVQACTRLSHCHCGGKYWSSISLP